MKKPEEMTRDELLMEYLRREVTLQRRRKKVGKVVIIIYIALLAILVLIILRLTVFNPYLLLKEMPMG